MAMALVTTGANKPRKLRGNNFLLVVFTVTADTGANYAAGGESLDLKGLNLTSPKQPVFVHLIGKAGFVYQYDLAAKKVFIYLNTAGGADAPLGEHSNAAPVAGVLGDVITGFALFV